MIVLDTIVLDTNVISELMRVEVDRNVLEWTMRQNVSDLVTTSITVEEIRFGLAILPKGKRRSRLEEAFAYLFKSMDALAFDVAAAELSAEYRAGRTRTGRSVSIPDAHIAGIVAHHGATLATRNTRDFEGFGLNLVNPWDSQ